MIETTFIFIPIECPQRRSINTIQYHSSHLRSIVRNDVRVATRRSMLPVAGKYGRASRKATTSELKYESVVQQCTVDEEPHGAQQSQYPISPRKSSTRLNRMYVLCRFSSPMVDVGRPA